MLPWLSFTLVRYVIAWQFLFHLSFFFCFFLDNSAVKGRKYQELLSYINKLENVQIEAWVWKKDDEKKYPKIATGLLNPQTRHNLQNKK